MIHISLRMRISVLNSRCQLSGRKTD